jgi:hypothetical protein
MGHDEVELADPAPDGAAVAPAGAVNRRNESDAAAADRAR